MGRDQVALPPVETIGSPDLGKGARLRLKVPRPCVCNSVSVDKKAGATGTAGAAVPHVSAFAELT